MGQLTVSKGEVGEGAGFPGEELNFPWELPHKAVTVKCLVFRLPGHSILLVRCRLGLRRFGNRGASVMSSTLITMSILMIYGD